ncbi:MAG: hypothetical protein J5847_03410 [Clostridia bacterium]|nr:hypothetical protein [Clostridia bacterium]
MSIRIGVVDGNREFFERFRTALRDQFPGEFEVYLFPTLEKAALAVEKFRVRIVLVEPQEPDGDPADLSDYPLPTSAVYVRLVDRMQLETKWTETEDDPMSRTPVLCRYRSTDEWRELLLRFDERISPNAYKALVDKVPGGDADGERERCKVVLFTSAAGGVGTSTVAKSFAAYCVRHSRRVLYLDLQTFPEQGPSDGGDRLYTMEDILLALRGHRYAPDAILQRAVELDEEGMASIAPPSDPSRLFDMTGEEIVTLLDLVGEQKRFSVILLDLTFDTSERIVLPLLAADKVVLVDDGMPVANEKTRQLLDLLPALCAEDPITMYEKTCLIYNRFQNGTGQVLETEVPLKLGGIGLLDIEDPRDLQDELSRAPAMERLYEKLDL